MMLECCTEGAAPADKLKTLGKVFAPSESQKLAIQTGISSYVEGTFPQVVRNIQTDWNPTSLAHFTN